MYGTGDVYVKLYRFDPIDLGLLIVSEHPTFITIGLTAIVNCFDFTTVSLIVASN